MNLGPRFNTLIGLTGLLSLALSATIALAETNETIKIRVKTEQGLSEAVTIENLEVGASEVVLTESGREALVTRLDDGLEIEIDGELINVALPSIESFGGDDLEQHRIMFKSADAGDTLVVGDDMMVIEAHAEHRFIHESCEDVGDGEECTAVKRIQVLGDGDTEWISEDGQHIIIDTGDGEVVDINVEAIVDGLDDSVHADGETRVIVIERDVEIHEEDDRDN